MSDSKRILFTGLTGLVGSRLAFLLAQRSPIMSDFYFSSFQRTIGPPYSLPSECIADETFFGDCTDTQTLVAAFSSFNPDIIVHISQMQHLPFILKALDRTNLAPHLVIVGTTGIYSKFTSCSKPYLDAESLLNASPHSFTVIRPSMIYGHPSDRNLHRLYEAIRDHRPIVLPDGGSSLFQPIFYQDVSNAILYILSHLDRFVDVRLSFNIPGPEIVSLKSIVESLSRLLSVPCATLPIPISLCTYLVSVSHVVLGKYSPITAEQILRLREDKVYESEWNELAPFGGLPRTRLSDGLNMLHNSYQLLNNSLY